jgi:catechol 2,3-dioxygenase-like lactoylglutathione lyase family enzyme
MTMTTSNQRPAPVRSLVTGLNHVGIVTADPDRLRRFYVGVFGATAIDVPAPPGSGRAALLRFTQTSALAVIEDRSSRHGDGTGPELDRGHLDHVALDVPTATALDEVRRRLVAAGASDGVVHDFGPMLSVNFRDPDGMASEVCWMRDHAGFDAHPPTPFEAALPDLDRPAAG